MNCGLKNILLFRSVGRFKHNFSDRYEKNPEFVRCCVGIVADV